MNSLSPPVRRLVAVALLVLLLVTSFSALRAVLGTVQGAFDEVRDVRFQLQQWRSRMSAASLPDAATLAQERDALVARLAWVGPPAEGEARLQSQLSAALREHGLAIEQLRSLPVEAGGPLTRATFELRGAGPEAALYAWLKGLEGGVPAFQVERAVIRRIDGLAPPDGQGAQLQFELRLVAFGVAAMPGPVR